MHLMINFPQVFCAGEAVSSVFVEETSCFWVSICVPWRLDQGCRRWMGWEWSCWTMSSPSLEDALRLHLFSVLLFSKPPSLLCCHGMVYSLFVRSRIISVKKQRTTHFSTCHFCLNTLLAHLTHSFQLWVVLLFWPDVYWLTIRFYWFSFWSRLFLFLWFESSASSSTTMNGSSSRRNHSYSFWPPTVILSLQADIGSRYLIDELHEHLVLRPEVLFNHLLRLVKLSNGFMVSLGLLMCLSLGLISLNMKIDLTQVELAQPFSFRVACVGGACELVELSLKATDALFAGDYCLFCILKCLRIIFQVYIGVADVQAQLWDDRDRPWLLLLG